MQAVSEWMYDEFNQVGKDYALVEEVAIYDQRHADFRDLEGECRFVMEQLKVGSSDVVLDLGSGTGNFAIHCAKRCKKVRAVDVSQAMLEYSRRKSEVEGLNNIEFEHAGFLNFQVRPEKVDCIASTFVLHHIPDFWKGLALKRMNQALKLSGKLYLKDVVIQEKEAVARINAYIDKLSDLGGAYLREDVRAHFREEFSTYDWVMDELLQRAGFRIDKKIMEEGVVAIYLCVKTKNVEVEA